MQNNLTLVTGGSGLVGTALKKVTQNDQSFIFLSTKNGDLTNYKDCYKIFDLYKPKKVIHLAAYVGGLYKNLNNPVNFWENNILINNNVLKCSHIFNVNKVVSCLSTCIFPDKVNYPIDESMIHNGPPHFSNEAYAYSKRMIDILNRSYNRQYGRMFTSVVPTNIYGPYDNFNLEDSHVIPAIIHKCYLAKKHKTPLQILGSGKPLRQFIFSEDLAKLILKVLNDYNDISPIILSVDEKDEISIKEVANLIIETMEFKGKIIWDVSKSDGQYKKIASNNKLRKLFGNFTFTPIKIGIEKTCKWFIENYQSDHIRK